MTDSDLADEVETLRQELAEAVSSLKVSYDRLIEANERADHWRAKYTRLATHVVGMDNAHRRALAELATTNVAAEGPTYNETAPRLEVTS